LLPAVTTAFDHQRVATNVDVGADDVPRSADFFCCVDVQPATDAAMATAAHATMA
jgi:hypothetical protein